MTRGTDVTDSKRMYREPVVNEFPDIINLRLVLEQRLRYGENPNQAAAMYRLKGTDLAQVTDIRLAKDGKGGLSATNFMDVTRALDVLKYFPNPSVAVMKHLVPSGFATQNSPESLDSTYRKARDADTRSAFGSVVVFNRPVDLATAEEINTTYVEGVAAPSFEEGVMGVLEKKKNLRAILFSNLDKLPRFIGDDTDGLYDIRTLPTGRVLVQKPYLTSIKTKDDLVFDPLINKEGVAHVVGRDPSETEVQDMLTAWYLNFGVRSNGIVFVKDGVTLAIGSGQQERVGAVEQAIVKAYQKAMDRKGINYDPLRGVGRMDALDPLPLEKSVVSSDAFFPFRDSIDLMARVGVSGIIQPGGSEKDYEVIDSVNQNNMSMVFTRERCFGHF